MLQFADSLYKFFHWLVTLPYGRGSSIAGGISWDDQDKWMSEFALPSGMIPTSDKQSFGKAAMDAAREAALVFFQDRTAASEPGFDTIPVARTRSFSEKAKKELAKLEDGDLLSAFQHGDEQAFYVLYERRNKEIFTHCLRMCSQDYEKANDAFQDTFVKVYTRRDLFTDTSNGRAWLYRIATNTCLNQIRYDKRHPKEALDTSVSSVDPKMQPDFQTGQDYLKEALERAIAKLPMELREPFLLRELEDFSYEEVAAELKLSVAACRQRVYRAKQMLREELEEAASGETARSKKKNWNPFGS